MMLLKTFFSKKYKTLPPLILLSFIVLSLVGFVDATYLTAKDLLGSPVKCVIFTGCEQVTTSRFSEIFGVPVALLGSLYYLTVLILAILYYDRRNELIANILPRLTVVGLFASAWFVYVQLVILKYICVYCMASATTSTLLFITSVFLAYQHNNTD